MSEVLTSKPMNGGELCNPVELANRILDRPCADPDDDLAILARQFLRRQEWAEKWHGLVESIATILGVNSAFGLDELAIAIPDAIQKIQSRTHETTTPQALVTAPDMREILICAEGGLLTSDPETRALALETVQRVLGGWSSVKS